MSNVSAANFHWGVTHCNLWICRILLHVCVLLLVLSRVPVFVTPISNKLRLLLSYSKIVSVYATHPTQAADIVRWRTARTCYYALVLRLAGNPPKTMIPNPNPNPNLPTYPLLV